VQVIKSNRRECILSTRYTNTSFFLFLTLLRMLCMDAHVCIYVLRSELIDHVLIFYFFLSLQNICLLIFQELLSNESMTSRNGYFISFISYHISIFKRLRIIEIQTILKREVLWGFRSKKNKMFLGIFLKKVICLNILKFLHII